MDNPFINETTQTEKEVNEHKEQFEDDEIDTSNVIYIAAVIASLGGLLFGYDIGIISGAKIQIQKEIGLSCLQIELIVAMLPVGAFVASLGGGKLRICEKIVKLTYEESLFLKPKITKTFEKSEQNLLSYYQLCSCQRAQTTEGFLNPNLKGTQVVQFQKVFLKPEFPFY